MTWGADTAYSTGLDFLSGVVTQVAPADWGKPSPCAGWRAVDVLGHIGSVVQFGTVFLTTGKAELQQADPPGSIVEGDPSAWWQAMVGPAGDALVGIDLDRVVDSPRGKRSIREGLSFPALDLFVHAWDIGRSTGIAVTIPDEAIEFARRALEPIPAAQMRSPGIFGPEISAGGPGSSGGADDSSAANSDSFLAWTGRDPAWRP